MSEARAHLQQSVALDPAFGLAHAHYALLTALTRNIGLLAYPANVQGEALHAAKRAIALDEGSSEVLGYAGCALCDLGHLERGIGILRQALQIDPSNAQAHVALGTALALMGQFEEGIETMRFGMKLSPRDRHLGLWGWALGMFLLRANRVDEALAEAHTASRRDSKLNLARVLEAAALDRLGHPDDARTALTAARQLRAQLTLSEVTLTHGPHVGETMALLWDPAV